jgi:hypothetical protein
MNKTSTLLTSLISSIAPKLIRYTSTASGSNHAVCYRIHENFRRKFSCHFSIEKSCRLRC